MLAKDCLPLIDLTRKQTSSSISSAQVALRQFGAFRLVAPQLTRNLSQSVFQNAREFFKLPIEVKEKTSGYSGFDTELVRGKTAIPKETICYKESVENYHSYSSPLGFQSSMEELQHWANLRSPLFDQLSTILDSTEPLIGTTSLDHESLGVNFYDSDRLGCDRIYFNPAHMDSSIVTILIRATEARDGLEIADLETTDKLDSEGIGLTASFIPVPAMPDEVIVLAGTRLQRLLGKNKVRACVHRVRSPTQTRNRFMVNERLSLAIFCESSMK
ncbi:unnamed protein product [Penicillium nalgiovense]|uniref:Fe2OG dioxygenase domain-containing protein n=1 Tax=Penicillium nalgiovense TaxID=60175 RepID=A0A9W4N6D0_PENNA|nr:unnamed protein product [Penicillium nalgiovense]CAG8018861.1 unnamed protein product [Penicillium nalgiovense]CAG8019183.1 unnamed protein product [Penicillium nalgiovense]CAG8033337.1 unnamed protein product [Penicillium nalgiovense]CAG8048930.1 unnamed protein product [Penicillium nalgiovense]